MTAPPPGQDLQHHARRRAGRRHDHVVLAACSPRTDLSLGWGLPRSADVEIGSLSKSLTGLLYADACRRGEIEPDMVVADLLPAIDGPAGDITLDALAAHRSGLARVPRAAGPYRRAWSSMRTGRNPYGDTLDELVAQVSRERIGSRRRRYSNTGYQLLGHASAAGADTTFADLLDRRLCEPLGLTGTYAPSHPSDLRPGAVRGRSRRGREHAAWTGEALAPAGGIRSTEADLTRLLRALIGGVAPGMQALDPDRSGRGRVRHGAGWVLMQAQGRTVPWHNGRTGGFASWLGLDREAGCGVAIVSATAASVDAVGFRTLIHLVERSSDAAR